VPVSSGPIGPIGITPILLSLSLGDGEATGADILRRRAVAEVGLDRPPLEIVAADPAIGHVAAIALVHLILCHCRLRLSRSV
jgi:hypothetical protein